MEMIPLTRNRCQSSRINFCIPFELRFEPRVSSRTGISQSSGMEMIPSIVDLAMVVNLLESSFDLALSASYRCTSEFSRVKKTLMNRQTDDGTRIEQSS